MLLTFYIYWGYIKWQNVTLTYFDVDVFWHLLYSPVENDYNMSLWVNSEVFLKWNILEHLVKYLLYEPVHNFVNSIWILLTLQ